MDSCKKPKFSIATETQGDNDQKITYKIHYDFSVVLDPTYMDDSTNISLDHYSDKHIKYHDIDS